MEKCGECFFFSFTRTPNIHFNISSNDIKSNNFVQWTWNSLELKHVYVFFSSVGCVYQFQSVLYIHKIKIQKHSCNLCWVYFLFFILVFIRILIFFSHLLAFICYHLNICINKNENTDKQILFPFICSHKC